MLQLTQINVNTVHMIVNKLKFIENDGAVLTVMSVSVALRSRLLALR